MHENKIWNCLRENMETTKEEMCTPTNADIARYLHRVSMHFCMSNPTMDEKFNFTTFEFRTEFGGTLHHFEAQFVDLKDFKVLCCNTEHTLEQYDRGNALKSLLKMRTFSDVEAFAVACRNALGDNLETLPLAGSIFVNGQCVDEILSDLEEQETSTEAETAAGTLPLVASYPLDLPKKGILKRKFNDDVEQLTAFICGSKK